MVVSPISVATALALLSQGANGNSFEQIENALHMTGGKARIIANYSQYHELIDRRMANVNFAFVNQIFVQQQNRPLNKTFQEIAMKSFHSGIEIVDFTHPTEAAMKINHFVAQKTNNQIRGFVAPNSLSSTSKVVLVNAIRMKAKWEQPFDHQNTYKGTFTSSNGDETSVDFMHATKKFNSTIAILGDLDIGVYFLSMKYADSDLSMLILLPMHSDTSLAVLESALYDIDRVNDFVKSAVEQLVDVSIPKFKIEHEIKLNDAWKRVRTTHSVHILRSFYFKFKKFQFRWE